MNKSETLAVSCDRAFCSKGKSKDMLISSMMLGDI